MKMLTASTADDSGFKRARSIAALKAVAEAYGWDKRPSPKPRDTGDILTGRGIAYAFRGQTIAAEIAEVEVNRKTGHVWVKRLACAYDCGLIVNPEALRHAVECAMLHSLSRALHEEVQFDTEKVTSVDWNSHPTLTHADTPARIDVVLVNGDPNPKRPDLAPYGAGETACKPLLAAVANAILRCDRGSPPPSSIPGCARACGIADCASLTEDTACCARGSERKTPSDVTGCLIRSHRRQS